MDNHQLFTKRDNEVKFDQMIKDKKPIEKIASESKFEDMRMQNEKLRGPENHSFNVRKEQVFFGFLMTIVIIFDCVIIGVFIHKILSLSDLLSIKEQMKPIQKDKKSKRKDKKDKKKKSKRVEESKEDIESNIRNEEPVIQEESVNLSVTSEESESSLIKNEEVANQQVHHVHQPQNLNPNLQQVYPQFVRIGDKTFIAVKASDIQNLAQSPQGFIKLERGQNNYMY